jgi:putative alpha-1,2-mannosidase
VLRSLYAPVPGGMPGNDDGGTMSAWWVLAALGIYPAVPGSDQLALSAPLFRQARLSLPDGTLTINAPGTPRAVPKTLNRWALRQPRIAFTALARGRHQLTFR